MSERPSLVPQFLIPAESGATADDKQSVPSVEAVSLKSEAAEATNGDYGDLVSVNHSGNMYVAAGNGNRSGKFLSLHQADMIKTNADIIHQHQEEYATAREMSEAGVADSDIEASMAIKRLSDSAEELEATALAQLNKKHPSNAEEPGEDRTAVESDTVSDVSGTKEFADPYARLETFVEEQTKSIDLMTTAPANEGESLDEYEDRVGVPTDQRSVVETKDEDEDDTAELLAVTNEGFGTASEGGLSHAVEQARQSQERASAPRSFRERARNAFTSAGFYTEVNRLTLTVREKMTKRKKAGIALGVLAVTGVVAWALLNRDAHQSGGGSGTFFADTFSGLDIDGTSDRVQDMADLANEQGQTIDVQPSFSSEAFNVTSGEGWYQTFADMNIPISERTALLDKIGPELVERGVAYPMGDSYGISEPGRLPEDVLQLIQDSRR